MNSSLKKHFATAVSAAGCILLAVLFLRWTLTQEVSALSMLAAVISTILFAIVGIRAAFSWADFWSPEQIAVQKKPKKQSERSWAVFAALLVWDLAILFLAWPLRAVLNGPLTLQDSMQQWVCGDGVHYLDIARDWYLSTGSIDRVVQLVFLPGYPIVIRLFHLVIRNWVYAALAASGFCFALAGTVLYWLFQLDLPEKTARRAVMILCLLPGAFFFAAPMSESLFLLCCVGCLYLARKNRWLISGLLGAYAAFTRSLGITLLIPLALELVRARLDHRSRKKPSAMVWLSLFFIPLGFGAYLLVNQQVSGNPFQFLIYQSEHWHQNLGMFFNTSAYQTDYAVMTFHDNPHNFWGLWLPNLIASFTALGIMIYGASQIRASYSVWFLPYYFIAIGATWLLSAPRYLLAFFPLSAALSIGSEKKGVRAVILIVAGILSILYFLAFLLRWQVY